MGAISVSVEHIKKFHLKRHGDIIILKFSIQRSVFQKNKDVNSQTSSKTSEQIIKNCLKFMARKPTSAHLTIYLNKQHWDGSRQTSFFKFCLYVWIYSTFQVSDVTLSNSSNLWLTISAFCLSSCIRRY